MAWTGQQTTFKKLNNGECFILAVDMETAGNVVYMKTIEASTADKYDWACCLASGKLYDFYKDTGVIKLDKVDVLLWLLNTPRMG